MRRRTLAAVPAVFLVAVVLPATLSAQSLPCTAPVTSNVAKLLAWFGSPLAFSQLGPLERIPAGTVKIGGDVTYVPTPPSSISRPDVCYAAKSEHTGLSPVFPRPRLIVGLWEGFSAEASYLPPLTVQDATPNLGSVALAWVSPSITSMAGIHFTMRGHVTFGHVTGPITCPASAIQQSNSAGACWASTPSKDTYSPNVSGIEAGLASAPRRLGWYGGVGYASLMPRFKVGYTAYNGTVDSTRVRVDLTRVSLFAGVGIAVRHNLQFSAQVYSVPEDATTGRAGFAWRVW